MKGLPAFFGPVVLAACGGGVLPPPRSPETPLPAVSVDRGPAASTAAAPTSVPEPVGAPDGYVEMRALRVAPLPQGDAVLLADAEEAVLLPIFVGGTEALSIQLRLAHEPFERPLTHDLLDSLLRELDGTIAKVQVDELRGTTFIGSVWLRHEGRVVSVDARPSDAIALAIGAGAPIYVARTVLTAAGLTVTPPSAPPAPSPSPPVAPPPRTF